MGKLVDMTGQRYGRLTILRRGDNDKHGHAQWWCQCDCGSPEKLINGGAIRRGLVSSCGCLQKETMKKYSESQIIDETGNTYGYLTVLHRATNASPKDGRAQWVCQCRCGNIIVATGKGLREGSKSSCGCMTESKGEFKVEQLLSEAQIVYSRQYTVYIKQSDTERRAYYFDFAIFDDKDKNKLLYLIEYDGRQHYKYRAETGHIDSKDNYERTVKRDKLKNNWCKVNNIPLIRIPYTQYNNLTIDDLKLETSKFLI